MIDKAEQKRCMTRYLLGDMSEAERAEFEKQYLADEELFEELVATETETIRSYLRGGGSEAERREFESHFLTTPSRRQRVEFEKSLGEYVSRYAPAKQLRPRLAPAKTTLLSSWRFAFVATLLLMVMGGSWMMLFNRRLGHELQLLRLEQSQREQQAQQLRQQVADLNVQLQHERTVTSDQQQLIAQLQLPDLGVGAFTLTPGLPRHVDQQKPLVIPRGLSSVVLQLRLDQDEYPSYLASLETAEGSRVWQQQNLTSLKPHKDKHVIVLKVPSNLLQSRTYILTVSGTVAGGNTEEVAAYAFRIVKP